MGSNEDQQTIEVRFPQHLRRFIDLPESVDVLIGESESARVLVQKIEELFPGVSDYILHENGKMRPHVNLFLDDRMISDRERLSDSLEGVNKVFVMQALSGG